MKRKLNFKLWLRQSFVLVAMISSSLAYAGLPGLADLKSTKVDIGDKQGKIIEIIDDLSKNTKYVFIYEDGIKKELNKKVQITNGKNLHDVLSDITNQSTLEFRAVNNNIVVKKRDADQNFKATESTLQGTRITGKVTSDDDGSGLPGVNVVQKGTTNGTVTDIDGNYSLEVPGSESILVFSSVGFLTEEISVGNQAMINLVMTQDITSLNEVVVTALGIERETKSLGYSVQEVDGAELTEVSQDNVMNSLAGKVAGVQINQTGGAGSTVSVVIRGATSLTTDNQPLFVVDGIPMSNSLNNVAQNGADNQVDYGNAISDISPDDIASMTVLKGPSAAALYGTRAGNGVILITTKSGAGSKKIGVQVSSSTLFEMPTKLLDFHYKYANGGRNSTLDEGSAYWGGPELDAGIISDQFGYDSPSELKSYPNNMKDFLQTGVTSNNSVALTGGGERGNYRFSYANMTMKGMIPNHDRFVNSFKTGVNFKILDNLTFTSNMTFSRSNSNDIPSTGDRRNNPLEAVYMSSYIDINKFKDYWEPGYEGIQQRRVRGDNPYFIAYGMSNAFVRDRVYGNVELKYDLTSDFSIRVRSALDTYNENRESKVPFSADRMAKGFYSTQDLSFQEMNSDILAAYTKVAGDFDISVSAGGNIMTRNSSNSLISSGSDRNNGLVVPGLYTVRNIPLSNINVSNGQSEKAIYSVYGLASLGYKGTLYLDLTARNDWSSTLPPENRSYFYPSASLSWLANYTFNLPEEVSLLKLRGGWAEVGNDTSPYQLEASLSQGSWNSLTTQSVPSSLLNPSLKPETATSLEFGVDLNMYNDRLRFSGTYYTMDNKDQIFNVPLPRSSGFSSQLINAGLISSEGWEFTFGGTPIKNSNGLTWDIDFNLTRNRTTVEELTDGLDFIEIWSENGGAYSYIGDQIGDIYSEGIAQVQDPNSEYYMWPIIESGGWVNLDENKDWEKVGNFNPDFMLGMQTRLSYGKFALNASFDWRQGGEFVSYTYRYGESDWRSQRQIDQLIPGGLMSQDELETFLKSNPEEYIIPQVGKYPRVGGHTAATGGFEIAGGNDGAFIPGVMQTEGADTPDDFSDDVYVEHLGRPAVLDDNGDEVVPGTTYAPITDTYPWSYNKNITFDASFIKLRELSLAYQLPKIGGVSNATFAVYTRNLMVWNKANVGIDPERAFQANGGDQGDTASQFKQGFERQNVMPWSASIGFKLNFNF